MKMKIKVKSIVNDLDRLLLTTISFYIDSSGAIDIHAKTCQK